MTIQMPVYGSDELVTMTPYELTFPYIMKTDYEGVLDYYMLDEIAVTRIVVFSDGTIKIYLEPHDLWMVENLFMSKEEFFSKCLSCHIVDSVKKVPVELSEIEETLKRFQVLLHEKIDQITPKP